MSEVELHGFALRAEYEGTVEVELEDGSTEERPRFGGGLLAVGDGDFDVAEELAQGDGVIVVQGNDGSLLDMLSVYPALKRVRAPEGARPVSPYARRNVEALRHEASLRDLDGLGSAGRQTLLRALEANDRAIHGGDPVEVAEIAAGDEDTIDAVLHEDPAEPPPAETTHQEA